MFLTHRTIDGERWDQLAYRYYGDALAFERIVVANPSVAIGPTLAGNQVLLIPVITAAATLATEDLPPWDR